MFHPSTYTASFMLGIQVASAAVLLRPMASPSVAHSTAAHLKRQHPSSSFQAPVSGSKKPAIDGQLVILAAGDKPLYDACATAFDIMGKRAFYLGAAGAGARMKLVVNMVMGSMMGEHVARSLWHVL